MSPKIATKSKPAAVIGGALIAALLGLWLVAYQPTMASRASAQEGVDSALSYHDTLSAQVATLKNVANDKGKLDAQVAEFVKQFPASADQPGTFLAIASAAKASGVTITSQSNSVPAALASQAPATAGSNVATVRPGLNSATAAATAAPAATDANGAPLVASAPVAAFPVAELKVGLMVVGTGSQVNAFIANLEALNRPVLVDSVAFTAGGVKAAGNATIGLRVFTARPMATSSTVPTPTTTGP